MPHLHSLINCETALALIKSAEDETVRNLLDLAYMEFVRDRFARDGDAYPLQSNFDMLYCVKVLKSFFSDREILRRVLSGGIPEAWFDESGPGSADRPSTLIA